jgi:uncharacterized protein (TIGR03067 family)
MHRIIGIVVLLTLPLLAVAGDDAAKELKTLKGNWKTIALEAGGKALPKEATPDFTMVVGDDGKTKGKFMGGEFEFTITVDLKKTPRTIDINHTSGDQKGKKQYGVYKLEGDKWTVCVTQPGKEPADRPKDFDTKDTTNVVFVFERVKEDKK